MKTRMIATRNGKPAYMEAPPRKRQSHVAHPLLGMKEPRKPGLLRRLMGVRG